MERDAGPTLPDTYRYLTPRHADHDPTDPDHPGNAYPGGDQDVTASYWAGLLNADGTTGYVWNCEACPAVGAEPSEAGVIRAMNAHVAREHPDSGYVPPPPPAR